MNHRFLQQALEDALAPFTAEWSRLVRQGVRRNVIWVGNNRLINYWK